MFVSRPVLFLPPFGDLEYLPEIGQWSGKSYSGVRIVVHNSKDFAFPTIHNSRIYRLPILMHCDHFYNSAKIDRWVWDKCLQCFLYRRKKVVVLRIRCKARANYVCLSDASVLTNSCEINQDHFIDLCVKPGGSNG